MAKILFTNGPQTVLDGAITSSAVTLTVVSSTGFPSSLAADEFFYIAIEDELLKVTGVSGLTWTAARGVDGTTGAAHASGIVVTGVLNKEAMDFLRDSIVTGGGGGGGDGLFAFTAPVNGDFSDLGGPTVAVNYLGISLTVPAEGAIIRGRIKSAPATPYTIEAAILPTLLLVNSTQAGLLFRDSATGRMHVSVFGLGAAQYYSSTFHNETTFNANYGNWPACPRDLIWMQISDNGTNRIFRVSGDGLNWIQLHSVARTDWLTANQVGFFLNCASGGYPAAMTLAHWREISS